MGRGEGRGQGDEGAGGRGEGRGTRGYSLVILFSASVKYSPRI